jgi:L-lactate utilization protein LutB
MQQRNFNWQVHHNEELTHFLKNNPNFQKLSWKFYHFKENTIKSLDESLLENSESTNKKKDTKGFKVKK